MVLLWVAFGPKPAPAEVATPVATGIQSTAVLQRIVIDPGHGGDNHGVVGTGGLRESRLVLELARQWETVLEKELGVQVYLTRQEGDPPLEERTAVANRYGADVFISLHSGGSLTKQVPGYALFVQDYYLEAGVAHQVSLADLNPEGPTEWHLAQAPWTKRSLRLAEEIDQALSEVLRVRKQGVTGLPLAVLAGAGQPAILLELGPLGNPEQERRLKTQGYRDALTRAIVTGLKSWRQWLNGQRAE